MNKLLTVSQLKVLTQAVAGALALLSSGAWAAAPDAGQLLDTLKAPSQEPLRKAPPLDVQREVRPALAAVPGMKVMVTGFRVTGNTAVSSSSLLPLLQSQIGKELDLAGLDACAASVSAYYRAHGYFVARAYLPAQDITGGEVEIAVLEGRIGTVTVKPVGPTRLDMRRAENVVGSSAKPGQVVSERGIERGLMLLNDLPGMDVKSTLVPGATPGASDLLVEATEGPKVNGSIDIDNFGNRYTGQTRLGANLNINDPANIGDLFTLRAMTSGTDMSYYRGAYLAPIGSDGFKLGGAYSHMNYKLGKDFVALNATGTAEVLSLYGMYPFIRSRNLDLYGNVGFDRKLLKDDRLSVNVKDKHIDLFNAGVVGDARDGLGGGGMWNYGATLSLGDLSLSANAQDQTSDAASTKTSGSYTKLTYNGSRLQHLSDDWSLYGALSGQLASKNLDSSEKFILGGTGVRAYPQGEGAGDEGMLLNLELRYSLRGLQGPGDLQLLGFVDTGHVTLNKNTWTGWQPASLPNYPDSYSLSGMGIGANYGKAGNFSLQTSYAWKLGNNPARDVHGQDSDGTAKTGRFWLQAIKWF